MIGRTVVTLLMLLWAECTYAQMAMPRVEVYATIGGIVGVTPMRIDNARRGALHGGFRADAGIQSGALGLALGARVWELAPTQTFGGHGLDGFLSAEWQISWDTRSTLRASVGTGFDEIDGGHGPERAGAGSSGVLYSLGAAREVIAPSGERLILSADIVVPHVNADVEGRRAPILELGFGYRIRDFNPFRGLVPR
jgi:hypothetical protein